MSHRLRKSNVVRDFMLWLFDVPYGEPYISATVDVTWEAASAWIEAANRAGGAKVTTHCFFTAAVGRLYQDFPAINGRVHQNRIYDLDSVDIAMPVNLLDTGVDRELSMVIVRNVEKLDPRGVAEAMEPDVKAERSGKSRHPVVRGIIEAGSKSPRALRVALSSLSRLLHDPRTAPLVYKQFPMSTLITNVGAALGGTDRRGIRFRAVAFSPPEKLVHVGSIWGLGPVERAPIVDGDQIRIAPVLPVVFIFDHRLVDGVMAGRILARLGEILNHPDEIWGAP